MKSALLKTTFFGIVVLGVHFALNAYVLGDYSSERIYWLDPVLFVLCLALIAVCFRVHKSDSTKTALTFSMMSMAKLITVGIIALVLAKKVPQADKLTLAAHILAPAMIFLLYEALTVVKLLRQIKPTQKEV